MGTSFSKLSSFILDVSADEVMDKTGRSCQVTYRYEDKAYVTAKLFYHPERLADKNEGRGAIDQKLALDMTEHRWPDDADNTEKIIQDMIRGEKTDPNGFEHLLLRLRDTIKEILIGQPPRWWPHILNNNHWHDVIKLIQICLREPAKVQEWIDNKETLEHYPFNRLVWRWGSQDGDPKIKRIALTGRYRIVSELLKNAKSKLRSRENMIALTEFNKIAFTRKQIILQGPPGTSKTWQAKQIAASMLGIKVQSDLDPEDNKSFSECRFSADAETQANENGPGVWNIVQFHAAYNYEDFVRGISARTTENNDGHKFVEYSTEDRILVKMANYAAENPRKTIILIIDEINRANLAAVFGELIYALEYRTRKVRLAYEKESQDGSGPLFAIPSNLYIIGTMNTADRSIGHIDYAIRRRFAFVNCLPERQVILTAMKNHRAIAEKSATLFDRVSQLFIDNCNETNDGDLHCCLSSEFNPSDVQVGHTYFISQESTESAIYDDLACKFTYQVYPILREYIKDGILNVGDHPINVIDGVCISTDTSQRQVFQLVHAYLSKSDE